MASNGNESKSTLPWHATNPHKVYQNTSTGLMPRLRRPYVEEEPRDEQPQDGRQQPQDGRQQSPVDPSPGLGPAFRSPVETSYSAMCKKQQKRKEWEERNEGAVVRQSFDVEIDGKYSHNVEVPISLNVSNVLRQYFMFDNMSLLMIERTSNGGHYNNSDQEAINKMMVEELIPSITLSTDPINHSLTVILKKKYSLGENKQSLNLFG
jgi:hypothetical protein